MKQYVLEFLVHSQDQSILRQNVPARNVPGARAKFGKDVSSEPNIHKQTGDLPHVKLDLTTSVNIPQPVSGRH